MLNSGDIVAPAGIVTKAGTDAREGFELVSVTWASPAGAAVSSVILLLAAVAPPTTEVGYSVRVNRFATVTLVEAERDGAATLVAVMVTVVGVVTEAGAVYRPVAEIVPTAGLRVQVTPWSAVPVTVAVNCCCWIEPGCAGRAHGDNHLL